MYNDMYDQSTTVAEQLYIIELVLEAKPQGAVDFYARALNNLTLIYARQTDKNEKNAADRSAILLSRALGEAQHTAAGPSLWYICQSFNGGQDTPLAKAAALEALGKVKAVDFLPQVVQVLNDLNAQRPSDRATQIHNERIAYGAIMSLENYREPEGYLPVFFASISWYSLRVRRQADSSFSKIMDDPSDLLAEIVNSTSHVGVSNTVSPIDVKYEALRASEDSNAPNNRKVMVAVAALKQGHNIKVGPVQQQEVLASIRKLALNMIRNYGTNDMSVYTPIDQSYKDGGHDEKLACLYALIALGGENSAQIMSVYLREIHNRRASGVGTQRQRQDEDSYVRVIIAALKQIGAEGRAYSAPILRTVMNTNVWTGYVQGLAREALQIVGN
ncbi:MAG: hypothetical protein LBH43_15250 [Treponema sp.]|nr:hypothetical protein [Treponema sp.]